MRLLKIYALLLLVLWTMRATSWAFGWLLARFTPIPTRRAVAAANAAAFALFVLLLYVNLMPGEPMDWAALLFGLVVFAVCAAVDLYWRPWKSKT